MTIPAEKLAQLRADIRIIYGDSILEYLGCQDWQERVARIQHAIKVLPAVLEALGELLVAADKMAEIIVGEFSPDEPPFETERDKARAALAAALGDQDGNQPE